MVTWAYSSIEVNAQICLGCQRRGFAAFKNWTRRTLSVAYGSILYCRPKSCQSTGVYRTGITRGEVTRRGQSECYDQLQQQQQQPIRSTARLKDDPGKSRHHSPTNQSVALNTAGFRPWGGPGHGQLRFAGPDPPHTQKLKCSATHQIYTSQIVYWMQWELTNSTQKSATDLPPTGMLQRSPDHNCCKLVFKIVFIVLIIVL